MVPGLSHANLEWESWALHGNKVEGASEAEIVSYCTACQWHEQDGGHATLRKLLFLVGLIVSFFTNTQFCTLFWGLLFSVFMFLIAQNRWFFVSPSFYISSSNTRFLVLNTGLVKPTLLQDSCPLQYCLNCSLPLALHRIFNHRSLI